MGMTSLFFLNYGKRAVLFPDDSTGANARLLTIPDNDNFDFGTGNFAIEIMFQWDSTIANPTSGKTLVAKSDYSAGMANIAGWRLELTPSSSSLSLYLNDGNATYAVATFVGACGPNVFNHYRIEVVRNVGVILYQNGNYIGTSTSITSRPGSVSNSQDTHIGGEVAVPTTWLKGKIHLVRIDRGNDGQATDEAGNRYCLPYNVQYGEVWNKEAYLKIAHFWPQRIDHYLAAWYFNNSLADASLDAFTLLAKDGNGNASTITYGSGPFWGQGYTMPFDPLPDGHEWGPIDLNDRQRALDGTFKIYRGATKQHKNWKFRTTDVEQVYAILGAYYQASVIEVHDFVAVGPNSVNLPYAMKGYFASAPVVNEISRLGDPTNLSSLARLWEITAEFIEA